MKDTFFYQKKTLNLRGKMMDLSIPRVMGILNTTPDSFYDGGKYTIEKNILERAEQILTEGGDIIDVGGYSTRPGAADVPVEEELMRVIPAIEAILKRFPGSVISIDTFRSKVALRAVDAGAALINDVSGGTLDDQMFRTVAQLKVPYILMHMKGTPKDMSSLAVYEDLMGELLQYFQARVEQLKKSGVEDIIIDPGFGFAKKPDHNFELLHHLNYFKILKLPILVGLSRKSMIYKRLKVNPDDTLNGTTVLNTIALMNGAGILRVHDVKACAEAVKLYKCVYP